MKRQVSIIFCMAILLMLLAACTTNSAVQVATPVPAPAGTPAPSGQINIPGLTIQIYAPGPNPLVNTPDAHGRPAGFWLGIWHGIISPFTLLASFLTKANVQMYEVHNDGSLYNLGFFIGILVFPAVLGLVLGRRG
jgi:hypothetical protein